MSTKPESKFMTALIQSTAYGVSITVQATGNHYSPDIMNDLGGRVTKIFQDVVTHLEEFEEYEEEVSPSVSVKVQELLKPE